MQGSRRLNNSFTIAAYRGGAAERPENTLCAFEHAFGLSQQIVLDLDVQLTRDHIPVVIHDAALERTTDGQGLVADHSAAQIAKLDAGYRFTGPDGSFPYRAQGHQVPTLDQVFRKFPAARFNVDLRANDPRYPEAILNVIASHGAQDRVIVVSEHDAMIQACRKLQPKWKYAAPMGEARTFVFGTKLRLQWFVPTPADYFMIPESHGRMRVLDERLISALHRRGKQVWVWTVNDLQDVQRLRAMGVDGVFTEFPERIVSECDA